MKYTLLLLISLIVHASKPDLLLLKVYKDQNVSGWVMSEKLDGIRAYWDGKQLLSRSGKVIHTPVWFTKDYPPFSIDGELWSKRSDFENISSIVRDRVPKDDWHQIKHYIFEVPSSEGNLSVRLAKVMPYENDIIKVIAQIKVDDKKDLELFLKEVEEQGGEGVVIRDPSALYINKRTSKALKVKSFYDAECEVIALHKGKRKYKDVLGSLSCKLANGIVFKIGSGFTNEERKNPPQIGNTITFKYKEFTKYGKPRFPVFIRKLNSI